MDVLETNMGKSSGTATGEYTYEYFDVVFGLFCIVYDKNCILFVIIIIYNLSESKELKI